MTNFVHLYTGNGKGKTTAALGLALRAAGAGLHVFLGQFVKGMHYSEFTSLNFLKEMIVFEQFGRDCFIYNNPEKEDYEAAKNGFEKISQIVTSQKFTLVILDEITIANYYGLIKVEDVLNLISIKPKNVELVLTGRYADKRLIEAADLVTEMKEIKHYYNNGILARNGFDK